MAHVDALGTAIRVLKINETVHFRSNPCGGMYAEPVKNKSSSCKVQPACPVLSTQMKSITKSWLSYHPHNN